MEACRDLALAWCISTTPDQARPLQVVCSSGYGQTMQNKRTDTGVKQGPFFTTVCPACTTAPGLGRGKLCNCCCSPQIWPGTQSQNLGLLQYFRSHSCTKRLLKNILKSPKAMSPAELGHLSPWQMWGAEWYWYRGYPVFAVCYCLQYLQTGGFLDMTLVRSSQLHKVNWVQESVLWKAIRSFLVQISSSYGRPWAESLADSVLHSSPTASFSYSVSFLYWQEMGALLK